MIYPHKDSNLGEDSNSEGTLIEAPREFERLFDEAEEAMNREAWTEASLAIGILLGIDEAADQMDGAGQDYFSAAADAENVTGSLKSKALQLIDQFPEAGNKVIELRYGLVAKQALEEAIVQANWPGIRTVIQKFSFTEAAERRCGYTVNS